ncbi:hypothetical protein PCASD_07182 [Puccinia coronata f. sp. avenae]|uniref:Uncharacterized protein n=1 Tax=Puccinia coronata f. sp. avenae TaxID=200324 RepID=A0A2N5UV09_9BASI|nr:hypothetical protein PCASD_19354 [Puccinia coronata f. sp. avenae]PLW41487.1 hypothetical protein PCASD_07182 [Puccinia coronata f. sp. avenae]
MDADFGARCDRTREEEAWVGRPEQLDLVVGASPAGGSAGTAPRVGGSAEGGARVSGGPADPLNDRSQTLTEALSLTDGLTWKT